MPAAKAWILEQRDDAEAATQPWDREGYRMPGGTPSSPKLAAFLPAFPANLRKQLKGADYPAPRAIMSAAVEGAQVDFETAQPDRVALLRRAGHRPDRQEHDPGVLLRPAGDQRRLARPEGVRAVHARTKVGVLGAGMMGAGIAYSCARAGIDVVLKDVTLEAAEQGKALLATTLLDQGRSSAAG